MDYDHFEVYAQMPVKPHVLIIPSDLRYFVKVNQFCIYLSSNLCDITRNIPNSSLGNSRDILAYAYLLIKFSHFINA